MDLIEVENLLDIILFHPIISLDLEVILTIQGFKVIMVLLVIIHRICSEITVGEVMVYKIDGVIATDITKDTTSLIESTIEVVFIHNGETIKVNMGMEDIIIHIEVMQEDLITLIRMTMEDIIATAILLVHTISEISEIGPDNFLKLKL